MSTRAYPHFSLGPVQLPGPVVILAPLSGITDFPFRSMVRKYGNPSLVVSEMIASPSMVRHIKKTLRRGRHPQEPGPISVQLAGNDPAIMAEAAKIGVDHGATIIDLNFGCPAKKIAINSYAGSALMKDEVLAGQIFSAVVKAVPVPVTVKMRKGWDDKNLNAPNLARIAQESGIAMVTVHGRTRCQFFQDRADWSFFQNVCDAISIPVIGNGDIRSLEDASSVFRMSGVRGIMVGRACYGKPWLIAQIRHFLSTGETMPPPPIKKQREIVEEHMDMLLEHYGRESGLMIMRKHLAWYSRSLPSATSFRNHIFQESCENRLRHTIRDFYKSAEDALEKEENT